MQNEVDETAREIKSKGGSAYSYGCDVSSCDDVKRAAAKVREDLQTVDIVVNNAGVMCLKDILSLTEKDIRRTININTVAHFWVRPCAHDTGGIWINFNIGLILQKLGQTLRPIKYIVDIKPTYVINGKQDRIIAISKIALLQWAISRFEGT